MWRYTSDFLLAGIVLQLMLLLSFVWSVRVLAAWLKSHEVSRKAAARTAWTGGILGIFAGALWGAFGLGAFMSFAVLYLYPLIIGKKLASPQALVTWMLLIQTVFITGPLWLNYL